MGSTWRLRERGVKDSAQQREVWGPVLHVPILYGGKEFPQVRIGVHGWKWRVGQGPGQKGTEGGGDHQCVTELGQFLDLLMPLTAFLLFFFKFLLLFNYSCMPF